MVEVPGEVLSPAALRVGPTPPGPSTAPAAALDNADRPEVVVDRRRADRWSSSHAAPSGSTMAARRVRMIGRRGLPTRPPGGPQRPEEVASVGMTLAAWPAWIAPNVRLTPSRGSDNRFRPIGRSSTTLDGDVHEIGGAVRTARCGRRRP